MPFSLSDHQAGCGGRCKSIMRYNHFFVRVFVFVVDLVVIINVSLVVINVIVAFEVFIAVFVVVLAFFIFGLFAMDTVMMVDVLILVC